MKRIQFNQIEFNQNFNENTDLDKYSDALPTPWRTQMWVQMKDIGRGRIGMRSLAHNILRGRGACWSSGMGLGRIDKLIHSHGPAHNPQKVVSA